MFSWTAGYVDNVANSKREFALVPGLVRKRCLYVYRLIERVFINVLTGNTNSVGWKENRFLERNTLRTFLVPLKDNSLFALAHCSS